MTIRFTEVGPDKYQVLIDQKNSREFVDLIMVRKLLDGSDFRDFINGVSDTFQIDNQRWINREQEVKIKKRTNLRYDEDPWIHNATAPYRGKDRAQRD